MAHGLVTTGVSFPDSTIQTTAADKTVSGTYIVTPPNTTTPTGGWIQVTSNLSVSKATYPALATVMGNETWSGQLGNIFATPIYTNQGLSGPGINAGANVSNGDRSHTRIATNGTGIWCLSGNAGKIYRSTNNAVTWSLTPVIAGTTGPVYSFAFGNGAFIAGGGSRLARSIDGGVTWLNISNPGGIASQNWHSVIYDPASSRWIGITSAGFVATSTDNGATWTNMGHNFPDRVYNLAVGQGYVVTASSSFNIGYSLNGGTSWTQDAFTHPTDAQRVNKFVYQNNRFFAIADNGAIAYTARNSNPTVQANWYFKDNVFPSRNTQVLDDELTDICFIPSAKIWIIGTNQSPNARWFWAPDQGDGEIPYWYQMTGMHPLGQQGWADSFVSGNVMVQNSYGLTPGTNDGYGNLIVGDGYTRYDFTNLATPPSTHFYVPPYISTVNYGATGTGNAGTTAPKVFVKT